jgi:alpha-N-arabinofuranosidase
LTVKTHVIEDAQKVDFKVKMLNKLSAIGKVCTLQSDDLSAVNSLDAPHNVRPKQSAIKIKGKTIHLQLKPYSINVIRVKLNN